MANKINYKFTPGQSVFVMDNNKITEGTVKELDIRIAKDDSVKIRYNICLGYPKSAVITERLVFATKAALLKSL